MLLRVYKQLLVATWNYTYHNLVATYNKFASKKWFCQDLYWEKFPHGSILVSDNLAQASKKSSHFGWSHTGGSTV